MSTGDAERPEARSTTMGTDLHRRSVPVAYVERRAGMEDYLVVGRIGRPHGLKGEVAVEPRTDEPDRRFAAGLRLHARRDRPGAAPGATGELTVLGTRW